MEEMARTHAALRATTSAEAQPRGHVPLFARGSQGDEQLVDRSALLVHKTLSPDSCYFSDSAELSPGSSRRPSGADDVIQQQHRKVGRSASDTLADQCVNMDWARLQLEQQQKQIKYTFTNSSEPLKGVVAKHRTPTAIFVDFVPENDVIDSNLREDADSDASSGSLSGSMEYQEKLEFALKLGYSETQLRDALYVLGMEVGQNELLSELVRLGAVGSSVGATGAVGGAGQHGDDVIRPRAKPTLPPSGGNGSSENSRLRPIVIDGSNVAMSHGNKQVFSCRGIRLAVDYFRDRGHGDIVAFVPQWRKENSRPDAPITEQELLDELEQEKCLVYTPARRVAGKRVVCYDDRYVIKLASESNGVVVSNDNYRDLISESDAFRAVIEKRLLMYSFVNDRFMPPDDPLGRHGPSLDNFLRKEPISGDCPYGKKCTYGNKCKYFHPERGAKPHKLVTERLAEQNAQRKARQKAESKSFGQKKRLAASCSDSAPLRTATQNQLARTKSLTPGAKTPLSRTASLTPGAVGGRCAAPRKTSPETDERNRSLSDIRQEYRRRHDDSRLAPAAQLTKQLHEQLRLTHSDPHVGMRCQVVEPPAQSQFLVSSQPHQKLQRTLSVRDSDDPRILRYMEQTPNATWSTQQQQQQQQHPTVTRMLTEPLPPTWSYVQCAHHSPHHAVYHIPPQHQQKGLLMTDSHQPLARMSSAPMPAAAQQAAEPKARMIQRQNSTSDPMLHMIPHELPSAADPLFDCVFPSAIGSERVRLASPGLVTSSEGLSPRGGMPECCVAPASPSLHAILGLTKSLSPTNSASPLSGASPRQGVTPLSLSPVPLEQTRSPWAVMPGEIENDSFYSTGEPLNPVRRSSGGLLGTQQQQEQTTCTSSATYQSLFLTTAPAPCDLLTQQMAASPAEEDVQLAHAQQVALESASVANDSILSAAKSEADSSFNETRNKLFYHLCGLFSKERVVKVMEDNPSETSAEVLCQKLFKL